ncbi:MAG: aminotransferase class IV, partial [Dehalococcoidia bacterium]|nr:aminotransferase class IV [Dehalococcoidia bacterium]
RDTVMQLARNELGIETVERSIDRSELYVADEAFFTGTATNVAPISSVDHRPIGTGETGPMTAKLQELFSQVALGKNPKYSEWYTFLRYD